ncbi:DUF2637 domain-containing protein [Actinomadura hibisca]|uniref:DUF2637 domain-containing protein n=1 Tax=Actinomadura hibisca TaxID=68565 RepID=UPI000A672CE1|nr:DUF2637 domain-containing protein [Actinomadura hibisca]
MNPGAYRPASPEDAALLAPGPKRELQMTVVKAVAGVLAPLIVALAALGGIGSFATVRAMAQPWFGELAWIVPIGMDVGVLVLLAWDLLMEYLDLPWPVLRWVAWAYIAGTVVVNVVAAGGDLAGSVLHAAMPVLFVTVMEGVRHLIRRHVGLATGTRLERIPAARWMLAPISTALLWRRMVLWHITTYRQGLELEQRHLLAVARLQQQYGRLAWRWRAPLVERLALQRLPAEAATIALPAGSGDEHPDHCLPEWLDKDLLDAAQHVLAEARRQGVRLNRTDFGGRLRERGFSIANERLAELRTIAETKPLRELVQRDPGRSVARKEVEE